ncbi:hypothetical protein VKT23_019195 [Stygiomarasmius scandens]|uniref:Uncharacterized protein n=1 Tax=Marasmiellus scandens TaxID=2682957 RepID=A0ABR1IR34_9AGAR
MALTLADLTKNKTLNRQSSLSVFYVVGDIFAGPISFTDGLTGSIHLRTREFVTSPNCTSIPRPPFGSTRDLYRRADARYGEDDPLLWPQPYNRNHQYLTCIPSFPNIPDDPYYEDLCLWRTVSESEMQFTAQGQINRIGLLHPWIMTPFSESVGQIRLRSAITRDGHKKDESIIRLLDEFDTTITICMNRLSTVSSALRDTIRGVAELQRACLYTIALMDYVDVYSLRISENCTSTKYPRADLRMGAFVWNDKDAFLLFKAGLPVYYVRTFNDFDHQNILSACSFTIPPFCGSVASPPYPVLFTGQAGADAKFAAIRVASINCFDNESPFQNMHLPGQYSSNYQIGSGCITSLADSAPSALGLTRQVRLHASSSSTPYPKNKPRRDKGKAQNPPKIIRDKFEDIPSDSEFGPAKIPAWANANKSIDVEHSGKRHRTGETQRNVTVLPDPGLFFGTEEKSRQLSYFAQWSHMREAWLRSCGEGREPVKVSVWRKILALNAIGGWDKDTIPRNIQQQEHKLATEMVESLFGKYSPGQTLVPSTHGPLKHPTPQDAKAMIRELCLLGFRHQLVQLDRLADDSRPKPSPQLSQASYDVSLAKHQRNRALLVDKVLCGGGPFTLPSLTSNVGLAAEHWSDRVQSLLPLWQLMSSWPSSKPPAWNRGEDPNLPQMAGPGEQWEKVLVRFYVQTYFNFFDHPPILPCRM